MEDDELKSPLLISENESSSAEMIYVRGESTTETKVDIDVKQGPCSEVMNTNDDEGAQCDNDDMAMKDLSDEGKQLVTTHSNDHCRRLPYKIDRRKWKLVLLYAKIKIIMVRDKHSLALKDLTKNFSVLMKCTNKFDYLVYEMFFIQELRPTLNVQSDSIRAKVFNQLFIRFFSLYQCFYCPFTPANLFILLTCIYIFTVQFYHSLDNDRSTVETSCFTVDFYR